MIDPQISKMCQSANRKSTFFL